MKAISAVVAALCLSTAAVAEDKPDLSDGDTFQALNEISTEMQECAAFFALGAECFKKMPKNYSDPKLPQVIQDAEKASERMTALAFQTGKTIGMNEKGFVTRLKLAYDILMKDMNNSCVNLSVILDRYSQFCGQLLRDADPRLMEVLAGHTCDRQYRCGE